jgi:hypothetical protein
MAIGDTCECLFSVFHIFLLGDKKLDDSKNKKLEATFYELLSFSLLRSSNYWILRKVIKNDEKLE